MKYNLIPLLAALILITSLFSCNAPTSIGADLVEEDEFLNSEIIDTLSLEVNLIYSDSVKTTPLYDASNNTARPYLVGTLNDEIFGRSKANLYTQVRLPSNDVDLGSNLVLDSVVLTLKYLSPPLYGDSLSTTSLSIYEVTETMVTEVMVTETTTAEQDYYSNQTFSYDPEPLGELNDFVHTPSDSVTINRLFVDSEGQDSLGTTKIEPHLRIKLNNNLGNRFLTQSGTSTFADKDAFLLYFKGLYITADDNSNVMAYFDLLSSRSRLVLYYSSNDGDGLSFSFPINSLSATANHYEHYYDNTDLPNIISQPSPNSQDVIYLQSMAGTGLEFEIPHLQSIPSIVVNKAQLELYSLPNTSNTYSAPGALFFTSKDDTTEETFGVNGSEREVITTDAGEEIYKYTLTFNFYSQQKYDGEFTNRLEQIFINRQSTIADRVIIGGPEHPEYPMKFKLIYTEL